MAKKTPAKFQPENAEEDAAAAAEVLVWMSGAQLEKEEAVRLGKMKEKILAQCREEIEARKPAHYNGSSQFQVVGPSRGFTQYTHEANGYGQFQIVGSSRDFNQYAHETAATVSSVVNSNFQKLSSQLSIDKSKLPRYPPIPNLVGKIDLTACSEPFEKQLTPSDVKGGQNRLTLSKEVVKRSILPMLKGNEDPFLGINVITYNPQGKGYEMIFKSWVDNKFYVLNGGWKIFYEENRLSEIKDFVTVWMFRHRQTRNICFALTWKTMPNITTLCKSKSQKKIATKKR